MFFPLPQNCLVPAKCRTYAVFLFQPLILAARQKHEVVARGYLLGCFAGNSDDAC